MSSLAPLRRAFAGLACVAAAVAAQAADPGYAGLALADAIGRMRAAGLPVLYSSDLVRPAMTVQAEPLATEPRAILAEIIAPHGLAVAQGPGGTLLLVRAGGGPAGRLVGRVRHADVGAPLAGVSVRLEGLASRAVTAADGRFAFPDLPPGRYLVAVDGGRWRVAGPFVARVSAGRTTSVGVEVEPATAPAPDEMVVSASQYELGQVPEPSLAVFSGADLQVLPGLGDDALRVVNRLPGVTGADLSAKGNIRGGEADDMLLLFDGLRLYNPFHLKDFQSAFSAIDPLLVQRMDVSTGGFPARFGGRMGAVIDIEALAPAEQPYRQLSLSFFNAAALASGGLSGGDANWIVAARRSNLDLWFDLLDPDLGSPAYAEVYGRVGTRLGEAWSVTGSLLAFDDDIRFADEDQEEVARAAYRDVYAWLRADYATARAGATVVAAHADLDSERHGTVDQPGVSHGRLDDDRTARVDSLQFDAWREFGEARVQAGAEFRRSSGRYRYRDEATFDMLFLVPGAPTATTRNRDLDVRPDGTEIGVSLGLRAPLATRLTAEAGLRWDRETLTAGHESRISPRLGLLLEPGPDTQLRVAWGRYWQPQAINELQVADGVTAFAPPQHADHWILGLEQEFGTLLHLRLEAYRKDYRRPRPRFENLLHTLVLLPELKPDRIRLEPQSAQAEGVELSVHSDPRQPLSWWAFYAWSRVTDAVGGVAELRAWDQRHAAGAGLLWRGERWEWSLAAGYRSGWPTTDVALATLEPLPLATAGPRNAARLDSYFALDARLARRWRLADGDALTAFVEITNLTDRVNQCCVEYEINDDPGETVLEVQPVDYLRLVPSLGFRWEF